MIFRFRKVSCLPCLLPKGAEGTLLEGPVQGSPPPPAPGQGRPSPRGSATPGSFPRGREFSSPLGTVTPPARVWTCRRAEVGVPGCHPGPQTVACLVCLHPQTQPG